ncbi:MAG: DnaJ domain-containing protein [Clostridia bacterium]|nr:DnaJ domain-containing protein [Clostridia bacterium]
MNDPYKILGVDRNATDDEIKDAYRKLAKKYHPDSYGDNPLADLAEEKMREINEAYDAIVNTRKGRKSTGSSGGSYSAHTDFPEVRNLIRQGRIEQALELLDGVPPHERNAEWYFLNGTVQYRRGWFDQAYTSFATASRMDPSNMEYRNAVMNAGRQASRQKNNPYRSYSGNDCDGCSMCQGLICADCCCECLGGDLIRCC